MEQKKEIKSYRDLLVWQQGMNLAKECYILTKRFPKEELYGLTSQIRRASSSIPANISEGYGRRSTAEYIRFLNIANGSLKELETHLLLSEQIELTLISEINPILSQCESVGRLLIGLTRSLEKRNK